VLEAGVASPVPSRFFASAATSFPGPPPPAPPATASAARAWAAANQLLRPCAGQRHQRPQHGSSDGQFRLSAGLLIGKFFRHVKRIPLRSSTSSFRFCGNKPLRKGEAFAKRPFHAENPTRKTISIWEQLPFVKCSNMTCGLAHADHSNSVMIRLASRHKYRNPVSWRNRVSALYTVNRIDAAGIVSLDAQDLISCLP